MPSIDLRGRRVPKLLGADVELANFVRGVRAPEGSGAEASQRLLAAIDGVRAPQRVQTLSGIRAGGDPQDQGRKFLATNGGCVYIDLDHLELCVPEVRSAFDLVAACRAMLLIALGAKHRADRELPPGRSLQLTANNSDGQSHSYGSHLNLLVSREAWSDLFDRRAHYLQWLASFQVSALLLAGQGKVGSENGEPWVDFQISQRADFFETLCGPQTTYRRPIVNSRDEPLCGDGRLRGEGADFDPSLDLARLHCIFFDHTLCEGASLLRAGCMQIALALIEAERVNSAWLLDDPVRAVHDYSRDPELRARARLVSGAELSAVELQRRFFEDAVAAHSAGELDTVPRAGEILALWDDTLAKLEARDWPALFGRLDWVTKRLLLETARQDHALEWRSAPLLHLDQLYGSLDPDEGLFWSVARAGGVERVVSDAEILHFLHEPPEDTRAWTRAQILRLVAQHEIEIIDWDRIRFRLADGRQPARSLCFCLDDPLGFAKAEAQAFFDGSAPADALPWIVES